MAATSLPYSDRFRAVEKRYRHRGSNHKNSRQRRRDRHLNLNEEDYPEVFDLHDRCNNTDANRSRISELPLKSGNVSACVILDSTNAKLFEIQGVSGLKVLTNAMPRSTQVQWALRALRDYSRQAYTNLSNLANDLNATNNLWPNAWHEYPNTSCKAWKALKSLRWANIGRHYDWTARRYLDNPDMPALPTVQEVYALTGMTDCKLVESGIVNFYPAGTMMGGHLDNAEEDTVNPIVSLSLGTQCIFLQGGFTREMAPVPIWLRSGDIVIMGGEARRCFHGVPLVTPVLPDYFTDEVDVLRMHQEYDSKEIEAFFEYMKSARININLRRVFQQ